MNIILSGSHDYGPLTNLVGTAGSIVAAGAAIALAWRGRTKWEPSEEDISKGPQKVGGLVAAVMIVLIWALLNDSAHFTFLVRCAIWLASLCVLSLLVYGFLAATQTYYVVVAPNPNETVKKNIIAGFWLTNEARESRRKNKVTTQVLLAGAAYDPDVLWSRASRGLAKMFFTLFYLGLTVTGTLALTCAAIILGLRTKG
jgi:hypothetical protein